MNIHIFVRYKYVTYLHSVSEYDDLFSENPNPLSAERCDMRAERRIDALRDFIGCLPLETTTQKRHCMTIAYQTII